MKRLVSLLGLAAIGATAMPTGHAQEGNRAILELQGKLYADAERQTPVASGSVVIAYLDNSTRKGVGFGYVEEDGSYTVTARVPPGTPKVWLYESNYRCRYRYHPRSVSIEYEEHELDDICENPRDSLPPAIAAPARRVLSLTAMRAELGNREAQDQIKLAQKRLEEIGGIGMLGTEAAAGLPAARERALMDGF